MAIAFVNAGGASSVSTDLLEYSHTVAAGDDRLLLLGVLGGTSDIITAAEFNGDPFTLLAKVQDPGPDRWNYLFYLLNPDVGTFSVSVHSSPASFMGTLVTNYTGVKQTGQPDNFTTATDGVGTTSMVTSLTTVANQCWTMLWGRNLGANQSAGTGSTERIEDTNFGGQFGLYDSNAPISPAGLTSMTLTTPDSRHWTTIMASFVPTNVTGATYILT